MYNNKKHLEKKYLFLYDNKLVYYILHDRFNAYLKCNRSLFYNQEIFNAYT